MYGKETSKHFKRLNKATKIVNDHRESIRIPKLDQYSLKITAYSDIAFSNDADLSSQLEPNTRTD